MLLLSSNIFSVISLFGTVEEIVSITEEEPEEIVFAIFSSLVL